MRTVSRVHASVDFRTLLPDAEPAESGWHSYHEAYVCRSCIDLVSCRLSASNVGFLFSRPEELSDQAHLFGMHHLRRTNSHVPPMCGVFLPSNS